MKCEICYSKKDIAEHKGIKLCYQCYYAWGDYPKEKIKEYIKSLD